MALGFTTTDLANLKMALVSGALRVQIGDRLVIYRSQAEILKAIQIVQDELNGTPTDTTTSVNVVTAGYRRTSSSDSNVSVDDDCDDDDGDY